jgi:hypothetical protein
MKNGIKHRNRQALESIFCFMQFLFYVVSAVILYAVLLSLGSGYFVSVLFFLLFLASVVFDVFMIRKEKEIIARYEDIYFFAKLSVKKSDADIVRIFCNKVCDCFILFLAMDDAGRKIKLSRIFLIKKIKNTRKTKTSVDNLV